MIGEIIAYKTFKIGKVRKPYAVIIRNAIEGAEVHIDDIVGPFIR